MIICFLKETSNTVPKSEQIIKIKFFAVFKMCHLLTHSNFNTHFNSHNIAIDAISDRNGNKFY